MSIWDWLRNFKIQLPGGGKFLDVDTPPGTCPIGWQPGALSPVFYGARDYGPQPPVVAHAAGPVHDLGDVVDLTPGPPTHVRVFFPSLDGAVFAAPILEGCGKYPLILFLHGHCTEAEHYKKWFEIPALLARCGYVVAAPDMPGIRSGGHPTGADTDLELLKDTVAWLRNEWDHKDVLMGAHATGVVGHSWGALMGGRYAQTEPVAAYASLSGAWHDWSGPARPLDSMTMPRLFLQGSGELGTPLGEGDWGSIPAQKHRVTFENGQHWDYLPAGRVSCDDLRGPCTLVPALSGDILAIFFARYLPPEYWPSLPAKIPPSLVPPSFSLTLEQEFYAGTHLQSFKMLKTRPGCRVTIEWVASEITTGVVTKP